MRSIPIAKMMLDKEEEAALVRVVRSGWLMQGSKVEEFEDRFAVYTGAKYAIAVSSGTAALHLALLACGIGRGDEVILPSFSFIASANSVIYVGARPVFVDIERRTYNIDIDKVTPAITKKTKAIMPVHQAGLPADMDKISHIAKKHKLVVIEDAACALGSEYKGKKIGANSKLTCFSFHPRKIISTGEGGMVTTDDIEQAEKIIGLRQHYLMYNSKNRKNNFVYQEYSRVGYNYRMTDLQAAIGLCQLNKLGIILKKRRELAAVYDRAFSGISYLEIPYVPEYAISNYQSYILRINREYAFVKRVVAKLCKKGIMAKPGITSIHQQPCYKKEYSRLILPQAEEASSATIILPLYPQMTKKEQFYVTSNILNIMRKGGV